MGKTLLGRYRVLRPLGAGGMGSVFEAADLKSGHVVAIKVLNLKHASNATSLARFQREATTAARLGRPHAVEIMEVAELETGEPYFVMERLHGETLRARMNREMRLPAMQDAVAIYTQLLTALEAIHAQGIIHRDIKPENIFLIDDGTGEPNAKLIDFGVSKLVESSPEGDASNLTETGIVVGTVGYVSPEQISSPHEIDARADLWACGISLYETLTGHRPFHGRTPMHVMLDIMNREPASPRQLRPHIPTELERIVMTALKKKPENRYATANAFRRDLLEFLMHHRATQPRTFTNRPPPPPESAPIPRISVENTSSTSLRVPIQQIPTDVRRLAEEFSVVVEDDTDDETRRR